MAKVTAKLQVTLPKALATQYRIKPGDDILWVASGDVIRVVPPGARPSRTTASVRLKLFDEASERIRARQKPARPPSKPDHERGWTREELYRRGRSR